MANPPGIHYYHIKYSRQLTLTNNILFVKVFFKKYYYSGLIISNTLKQ